MKRLIIRDAPVCYSPEELQRRAAEAKKKAVEERMSASLKSTIADLINAKKPK